MPKITFLGAGSTIFAKNVLGDSMLTPSLADSVIALYDIDPQRLEESHLMLTALNNNLGNKARIETYCGVENRRAALRAGDEHHSPGHKQNHDRAQRRRQMRIDVLDADFGQNRRQRGEQRGQQRIHAPHTGPFFPMGFYRSHYITKR